MKELKSIFSIIVLILVCLTAVKAELKQPFFQMRGEHFFAEENVKAGVWLQWQSDDLRFITRPESQKGCEAKVKLKFSVRGVKKKIFYEWQTVQTFIKKESDCQKEEPLYALKIFALTEGTYLFTCEVEDLYAQTFYYKEVPFTFYGASNPLSDVRLFHDFGRKQPMIGNVLADEATVLPFQFFIQAGKGSYYTLKTALYHKEDLSQGESATHYLLVQQKNGGLIAGQKAYHDYFNMEGLPSGAYLMEVYLFEDKKLIARQSRACILPWKGLKKVRSNLSVSIDQMAEIAPQGVIRSLRRIKDRQEQLEAFNTYWMQQNNSPDDHPTASLERYYQAVYQADTLYRSGKKAGWQTETGRTFLQFGKPNAIKSSVKNGKSYKLWHYHRYGWVIPFVWNKEEWVKC